MSFDEKFLNLNNIVGQLSNQSLNLDKRVKVYNTSLSELESCNKILSKYKKLVETPSSKKIKKDDLNLSLTSLIESIEETIEKLSEEENLDKAVKYYSDVKSMIQIALKIIENAKLEIQTI